MRHSMRGEGGSFWNPRRKYNRRNRAGQDVNQKNGGSDAGDRACSNPEATATDSPHGTSKVANESRISLSQHGRRRRRAPLKTSALQDVLLIEIWEMKGSVVVESCLEQDVKLPPVERGGHEERERSAPPCDPKGIAGNSSNPLDAVEEASDRYDSDAEPLTGTISDHNGPTATAGDSGESASARDPSRHCDDANVSSSVQAMQSRRVDDDLMQTASIDGVPPPDDEPSSVAPTDPAKTARRRTALFSLPFRGRRTKTEGPSKPPLKQGPRLVQVSGTEPPQYLRLAGGADGNGDGPDAPVFDKDAGRQKEAATLCERGEGEMHEATLGSNASSVQEETGTDDEDGDGEGDGDGDDDDGFLAKRRVRRIESSFFSSFKGRKSNKNSPRPAGGRSGDNLKPVLWGRLTMPVADAMHSGMDRPSEDFHESLVNGQKVLNGVTDGANKAASDRLPDIRTTKNDVEDGPSPSMFGNIISRGKKQKNEEVYVIQTSKEVGSIVGAASESQQRPTSSSAVESWFDVRHPNGKPGERAKGRLRMTLTCGGTPARDNVGAQGCLRGVGR